jgi:hypothetical protein
MSTGESTFMHLGGGFQIYEEKNPTKMKGFEREGVWGKRVRRNFWGRSGLAHTLFLHTNRLAPLTLEVCEMGK